MHGKGIFTYSNGAIYDGDFNEDKKVGKGVYIYADGSKYTGEFFDDNMHGKGVITYAFSFIIVVNFK